MRFLVDFALLLFEDVHNGTDSVNDLIVDDNLILESILNFSFIVELVLSIIAEHFEVVVNVHYSCVK